MSLKRSQILDRTWPGLFKEHILQELPVHDLAPLFDAGLGGPTKDLHTFGAFLLFNRLMI